MGLSIVDYMTGITTAVAVLSSLIGVMKSGRGGDIDVSLFDVALHQLTYPGNWYLNEGHRTERLPRSSHPSAVPVQLFRTARRLDLRHVHDRQVLAGARSANSVARTSRPTRASPRRSSAVRNRDAADRQSSTPNSSRQHDTALARPPAGAAARRPGARPAAGTRQPVRARDRHGPRAAAPGPAGLPRARESRSSSTASACRSRLAPGLGRAHGRAAARGGLLPTPRSRHCASGAA